MFARRRSRAGWIVGVAVVAAAVVPAQAYSATAVSDVRVTTHDIITTDLFGSATPPTDVLQQNEPSIAIHPANHNIIAVGVNDVRTVGISDDAWQGLAVSTNGGASFAFETLIPGFPGDTSPEGLASPVRGNAAASDPWLGFDSAGNLYFSFIAFQRTPPGKPSSTVANVLAVAKYHISAAGAVTYVGTFVVQRGTVGLGQQHDKEALAVDQGNNRIYVCWARFTGSQNHLSVRFSSDGGQTWHSSSFAGPQSDVNNMQGCNITAAPNHDVYVSWRTFDNNPAVSNPNDSAIFVARSTNAGSTFSTPRRVATFVDYRQNATRTPPIFRVFADTTLAADANGVYVGWHGRSGANGADVFISRSKTNGQTWEAPVKPTPGAGGHQIMPSLAAAGGELSVIWYDSRSEPAFTPSGPVTGQCPAGAITGAGCTGMDVYYSQAATGASGPLTFGAELRLTDQSFNPNLWGSIKAITPFIGDYVGLTADADTAYAVWTDNRDINPTASAAEDADPTTDPPALINARSRDANVYFDKIAK